MPKNYSLLIHQLSEQNGFNPEVYDPVFFEQTVAERLQAFGISRWEEYRDILGQNAAEVAYLRALLSNSHSEFFRNSLTFAVLEQYVIPQLFSMDPTPEREVRIWSAGCAAGQEPCSVAILAEDFMGKKQQKMAYRIFATDHSEAELEIAREGTYSLQHLQNTRLSFVNTWFQEQNSRFRIADPILQKVDYSVHDLLDTQEEVPPASIYGNFDMILCCNVLYYYNLEVRNLLVKKLCKALRKGGFFITSEAETDCARKQANLRQLMLPAPVFIKF